MASKKAAAVKPAPEPAPAPSTGPKPKYVIIAESKVLAGATAERDWGWAKTKTGWTDPEGHAVTFVADITALTKLSAASLVRVYEGYRWYAVIAPHHLHTLVKAGAVELMPPPKVVE